MLLNVIEQDGEKFVVLPEEVLEQCGVGDVVDISVENHCIVIRAVDTQEKYGEKFVVLPDNALEKCGIGDVDDYVRDMRKNARRKTGMSRGNDKV